MTDAPTGPGPRAAFARAGSAAEPPTASIRSRLARLLVLVVVVGVLLLGVGVASFTRLLDARAELVDRLHPAQTAAEGLSVALLDQETGVRGYALTGDAQFLEPQVRGADAEATVRRQLEDLLAPSPRLLDQYLNVAAAADAWTDGWADPVVELVAAGGEGAVSEELQEEGRVLFDRFRTESGRLVDEIEEATIRASGRLDDATLMLVASVGASVLGITLMAAGLGMAISRWLLRPLAALGADAREVAGGSLTHPVEPAGTGEVRQLAADVEAMRARIVAEVELIEAARWQLEVQAQDLARSNAELEQFAYVASHDLQEPLRKVASFCQLIEQRYGDQLDERGVLYIEYAVDGAKRMQSLINDLLAFSRVGRTTDGFANLPLAAVVADALANVRPSFDEAEVVVEVAPLPSVLGDRSLLTALFQNLFANAVKFRAEAPPTIEVACREHAGMWELSVSDNGIGIEPQYAERVFVIFQRLHGRDEYEGTGIGLAMCRKIVEFHGGTIWVDPQPDGGTGTTIRLTLPHVDALADRAGPGPPEGATAPTPASEPAPPERSAPADEPDNTAPAGPGPEPRGALR